MRRKHTIAASPDAHATRVAWWVSFLATVSLIAILGLARSAQAQTVVAPLPGNSVLAALAPPDEEPEDEAEASESEEDEIDPCEIDEDECEEEDDVAAPQECLLSSAEATVAASHEKVRLRVRYTSSSPTSVTVDYGLHGAKGSLFLGSEKARVDAQGVLRLSRRLTEAQMAKVLAAKNFTVRLRVAGAPGYCRSFFDHQLAVRRATPAGLAWSQAE